MVQNRRGLPRFQTKGSNESARIRVDPAVRRYPAGGLRRERTILREKQRPRIDASRFFIAASRRIPRTHK